jgi:HEAT repeat protein
VLSQLYDMAGPAVPALIVALNDEAASVRERAARALGNVGVAAKNAVPALTQLLEDKEDSVRAAATDALKTISANVAQAAPSK